jgi:hypothetical protein
MIASSIVITKNIEAEPIYVYLVHSFSRACCTVKRKVEGSCSSEQVRICDYPYEVVS